MAEKAILDPERECGYRAIEVTRGFVEKKLTPPLAKVWVILSPIYIAAFFIAAYFSPEFNSRQLGYGELAVLIIAAIGTCIAIVYVFITAMGYFQNTDYRIFKMAGAVYTQVVKRIFMVASPIVLAWGSAYYLAGWHWLPALHVNDIAYVVALVGTLYDAVLLSKPISKSFGNRENNFIGVVELWCVRRIGSVAKHTSICPKHSTKT